MKDCDPADRRIELDARVKVDGQSPHITVTDHGHGIAADGLERVFDAFFTTKPDGLGRARDLQEIGARPGPAWAARNVGPGAAFHMTLPAANAGGNVNAPPADWGSANPPLIAIVDDEASVRRALGRLLGGRLRVARSRAGASSSTPAAGSHRIARCSTCHARDVGSRSAAADERLRSLPSDGVDHGR